MIVDSSAIIAVLVREPDAERFELALDRSPRNAMSTATYVELVNVIDRKAGSDLLGTADELLVTTKMELVPFSLEQARWARHARLTYGRRPSSGQAELWRLLRLCAGKSDREPLLFKGDDFGQTDVVAA